MRFLAPFALLALLALVAPNANADPEPTLCGTSLFEPIDRDGVYGGAHASCEFSDGRKAISAGVFLSQSPVPFSARAEVSHESVQRAEPAVEWRSTSATLGLETGPTGRVNAQISVGRIASLDGEFRARGVYVRLGDLETYAYLAWWEGAPASRCSVGAGAGSVTSTQDVPEGPCVLA